MPQTSLSVTEFIGAFSTYISRVAYYRESFVVCKNGKPVAEIRPVASGPTLGELEAALRSLPTLPPGKAADFAADMEAARAELRI
jgi:antitoxin (DNA-binding transcriptional repressor) of toxin-antitoxin stability system